MDVGFAATLTRHKQEVTHIQLGPSVCKPGNNRADFAATAGKEPLPFLQRHKVKKAEEEEERGRGGNWTEMNFAKKAPCGGGGGGGKEAGRGGGFFALCIGFAVCAAPLWSGGERLRQGQTYFDGGIFHKHDTTLKFGYKGTHKSLQQLLIPPKCPSSKKSRIGTGNCIGNALLRC